MKISARAEQIASRVNRGVRSGQSIELWSNGWEFIAIPETVSSQGRMLDLRCVQTYREPVTAHRVMRDMRSV